jgi:hypothetical protein
MKTLYLHRVDLGNPGDLHSSPQLFLGDGWQGPTLDLMWHCDLDIEVDFVVVGGGAVLQNHKFVGTLLQMLSQIRYKHLVIWGAGHDPDLAAPVLEKSSLWGVREYADDSNDTWVPCVSGTHRVFRDLRKHQATKDFLIINHWKRKAITINANATRIKNNPADMINVVQAIANHRYILTSSYHAAYWAVLMKRRVVFVSDPWHNKLKNFRWSVPQAEQFTWDLLDQTEIYHDAIDIVGRANHDFRQRVYDLAITSQ